MSALLDGTTRTVASRPRRLRRLGLASAAAGAAALIAGVAYAFLTANGGGPGSAATGSVSIGSPVSTTCPLPNMVPGDLTGSRTCSFGVTYTGSLDAYMSLTVQVQTAKGSGGTALYPGSATMGLTLSISDGHNNFTVPTTGGTTGSPCPTGYTCFAANNDLAAWYTGSTPTLAFSNGKTVTWTVTPLFPKTTDNHYQGAKANVTLIAQAVQTGANTLPSGCTTSTIGQPCAETATFQWSS